MAILDARASCCNAGALLFRQWPNNCYLTFERVRFCPFLSGFCAVGCGSTSIGPAADFFRFSVFNLQRLTPFAFDGQFTRVQQWSRHGTMRLRRRPGLFLRW
jgi:hypothetical protein